MLERTQKRRLAVEHAGLRHGHAVYAPVLPDRVQQFLRLGRARACAASDCVGLLPQGHRLVLNPEHPHVQHDGNIFLPAKLFEQVANLFLYFLGVADDDAQVGLEGSNFAVAAGSLPRSRLDHAGDQLDDRLKIGIAGRLPMGRFANLECGNLLPLSISHQRRTRAQSCDKASQSSAESGNKLPHSKGAALTKLANERCTRRNLHLLRKMNPRHVGRTLYHTLDHLIGRIVDLQEPVLAVLTRAPR